MGGAGYARGTEDGVRLLVGVNTFGSSYAGVPVELVETEQVQRGRFGWPRFRVGAASGDYRRAAANSRNTMPVAQAYCTLGERLDLLRETLAGYREPAQCR
ncbi:MAG: hypothetical protein OXH85_06115 [Truepera sp.]|nr:hypothetical protein [Truepera sp.]